MNFPPSLENPSRAGAGFSVAAFRCQHPRSGYASARANRHTPNSHRHTTNAATGTARTGFCNKLGWAKYGTKDPHVIEIPKSTPLSPSVTYTLLLSTLSVMPVSSELARVPSAAATMIWNEPSKWRPRRTGGSKEVARGQGAYCGGYGRFWCVSGAAVVRSLSGGTTRKGAGKGLGLVVVAMAPGLKGHSLPVRPCPVVTARPPFPPPTDPHRTPSQTTFRPEPPPPRWDPHRR